VPQLVSAETFRFSASFADFVAFVRANAIKVAALVIAYVLMLSVIGMQNVPFIDDSHRRLTGSTDFGPWDGRWGSELVAVLLNQGNTVVDLGLTTFILSGVILAFASCLIVYALAGQRANWLTFVLAATLGLNPWYLNAAAFRFDGPLIALSVLFAAATILFIRARPLVMFIGYALLTWVVTNFFQPMLGLALTLLLTFLLLNWLRGDYQLSEALRKLGIGALAVGIGALLYLIQSWIVVPGRTGAQAITFDFGNTLGALELNTEALLRQFIYDSNTVWLVVQLLVAALFVVGTLLLSRLPWWQTIIALIVYVVLGVLASGNILLLATTTHIITNARFMAPLAMVLTLLAVTVSTLEFPKPLLVITRAALVALAYIWLSVVFIFANVIREQADSLRFQVVNLLPSLFQEYNPGDVIVYDPRILHNSVYFESVQQRFPIFHNDFYSDVISPGDGSIRFRIAEMLGLNMNQIVRFVDPIYEQGVVTTGAAVCPRENAISEIIPGPHWEIFRVAEGRVCIALRTDFLSVQSDDQGDQTVWLNLVTFPFSPGTGPNLADVTPWQFELAVWSRENPADVQWVFGVDIVDGKVMFWAPRPFASDWVGDLIVGHFFFNGEFIYQHIWPVHAE